MKAANESLETGAPRKRRMLMRKTFGPREQVLFQGDGHPRLAYLELNGDQVTVTQVNILARGMTGHDPLDASSQKHYVDVRLWIRP